MLIVRCSIFGALRHNVKVDGAVNLLAEIGVDCAEL
jgi:hypothetical protein